MEKASKWIRNLLLGKPNKDNGRIELGSHDLPPLNPKAKRRWSFKRSTNQETGHKFTRSVDSIDVARLGVYLSELQSQDRMKVLRVVVCGDGYGAATKIQSVFRGYLARKALRALKGLVKLQAAVRGYLVRKQSRATLRCFHSLISIQSRAQVHRVQMAKTEPGFIRRRSTSYKNPNKEINDSEFYRAAKSKSSHFNFPTVARIEHGFTTYYSGDISDSNRETCPARYGPVDVPDFVPHYMSNTESSKAKKTRSQSEPKQRPRQSQRVTDSTGPIENRSKKYSLIPMSNADFDGRDLWYSKLYKERRSVKDSESESTSSGTSKSNYSRSLLLYEPHLTMY